MLWRWRGAVEVGGWFDAVKDVDVSKMYRHLNLGVVAS